MPIRPFFYWMLFSVVSRPSSTLLYASRRWGIRSPSMRCMTSKSYQAWTMHDDQILWDHRDDDLASIASRLGRGLRGTEQRLAALKDVDSPAYLRLFGSHKDFPDTASTKRKLVPAMDVLRRIQWDDNLPMGEFSILYFDRVEKTILEAPMDAPNETIAGKQTLLIDALPEHRIVAIKYKQRIVWDREKRLDNVFSNEGILKVIETYDDWKRLEDQDAAMLQERKVEVTNRIRKILGLEQFDNLKNQSTELQSKMSDPSVSKKREAEKYVAFALDVFQIARQDPSTSLAPELIPMNEADALDCLSELVALMPDEALRTVLLNEIQIQLNQAEGKKLKISIHRELPQLNENDLVETYVRGSGPGGQKINKTSNRVVLLHEPTQLRVECQETRSLQENRMIARKWLRKKLDDFLHGSQSKSSLKAQKEASKKQRKKDRGKRRRLQKEQTAREQDKAD